MARVPTTEFCLGFCQDYWLNLKGWRKFKGFFHCYSCISKWGLAGYEGFPPMYRPRQEVTDDRRDSK